MQHSFHVLINQFSPKKPPPSQPSPKNSDRPGGFRYSLLGAAPHFLLQALRQREPNHPPLRGVFPLTHWVSGLGPFRWMRPPET